MVFSLILTYIILNVLENRKMKRSERRLEKDRRNFSYYAHIPEEGLVMTEGWATADKSGGHLCYKAFNSIQQAVS